MKNKFHAKFRDESNNLTENIYAFNLLIMCSKVLLLVDGIHCLTDKLMERSFVKINSHTQRHS